MKKIQIKICSGTACYVMGASNLFLLKDSLTKKELEKIEIEITECLNLCKDEKSKSPYVIINGEVLEYMNLEKLVLKVKKLLNKV